MGRWTDLFWGLTLGFADAKGTTSTINSVSKDQAVADQKFRRQECLSPTTGDEPAPHQFLRRSLRTTSLPSLSSKGRHSLSNRRFSNETLQSLASKRKLRDLHRTSTSGTIIRTLRGIVRWFAYKSNKMPRPVRCRGEEHELQEKLRLKLVMPKRSRLRFLPESTLAELICEREVVTALQKHESRLGTDIEELAQFVCKGARRIFAILVWSDSPWLIEDFFDCEFTDHCLPVKVEIDGESDLVHAYVIQPGEETTLHRHPFDDDRIWTQRALDHLCEEDQWLFLSPVFEKNRFEYHFHEHTRLPFVEEQYRSRKASFFSVVEEWRVHSSHFRGHWDSVTEHPRVAIKQLKQMSMTDEEYRIAAEAEAATLKMLRDLDHDHLVKAIAYYTKGRKHYVMFPWADGGNLRDLWTKEPSPTKEYLKWIFAQLCGLAEAIRKLHHSQEGHVEQNWRHGDLKPENILCFESKSSGGPYTLVIADVGLSKGHDKMTELRNDATRTKSGTIMYEPPETELHDTKPRSRRYDIWSMGCIYLEFVIWYLYGSTGLEQFAGELLSPATGGSTRFYTMDSSRETAQLNTVVQKWIDYIKQDPRCSETSAIYRLVELIATRLLVSDVGFKVSEMRLARADSVISERNSGHSLPSIPPIIVRSPTAVFDDSDESSQKHRAGAPEMHKALKDILEDATHGRCEWMNWESAPSKGGPGHFANKLAASDARTVTMRPSREQESDQNEYRFTPLDDNWEYLPDSEIAHKLFLQSSFCSALLQPSRTEPHLCGRCKDLQLWGTAYRFSDTVKDLELKSRSCNLCDLLWHAIRGHLTGFSRSVQFFRSGSSLICNETAGYPVASLYCEPGKGSAYGDEIFSSSVQPGLPILSSPGSTCHIAILAEWIRNCDNTHQCCTSQNAFLPTRVLDVGEIDGPSVRLIDDVRSHTRPGRYVALSHRWGSNHRTFCTYKRNREQFKERIALAELPKTFKDAVDITRKLGLQYLWIDSLCIIQDDEDDWDMESKLMEQVFSSAYVTIAASCADGTEDRFLKPRPHRQCVRLATDNGQSYFVGEAIDNFALDVEQGELNKRGWVFQERALSRRTIYFSEKQTYWECGGGVRCETLTKMKNRKASFLGDSHFPNAVEAYVKGMKIEFFQDLYEKYSRLALSYKSDRPIAIRGLEKRLIRALDTVGGYGIFECFKHRSLLWRRADQSLQRITPIHRKSIPSWSWMAYDGGIKYLEVPFDRVSWNKAITTPFKGRTASSPDIELSKGFRQIRAHSWALLNIQDAQIYMDEPERTLLYPCRCVVLGVEKNTQKAQTQMHYVIIVTKSDCGQEDVYERVGVGFLERRQIAFDGWCLAISIY